MDLKCKSWLMRIFAVAAPLGEVPQYFFVDWRLFSIFEEVKRVSYEAELETWNNDISSACGAGERGGARGGV